MKKLMVEARIFMKNIKGQYLNYKKRQMLKDRKRVIKPRLKNI